MTREEAIKQLLELREYCDFMYGGLNDSDEVWNDDVEALDLAITALRGTAHRCIDCAYWRRNTDPETGAEIHICCNAASPRLGDLTEGSDHCGYWQADA